MTNFMVIEKLIVIKLLRKLPTFMKPRVHFFVYKMSLSLDDINL